MNYREVEILGPTDLTEGAGTKPIDIDLEDPISSLEIIWRTTVATVSDMLAPHVACLPKVELIDGSDVLFSLSGEEMQALDFYTQGRMPLNNISVVIGDIMESVIPYHFGRFLFDPELAFNPRAFRNPQLKITYDEDAANTAVEVNEITVRAWVFDDKAVSPRGFLMTKEIEDFTPVADKYHYTNMPTDYPYRLILFRSKSTDTEPISVLGQFKLSENHDKKIPLDMTGDEIFFKIVEPYGRIEQTVRLNETAADAMALYLAPTFLHDAQVDYALDISAAGDDYAQVTFANNLATIAATVAVVPYRLSINGYCPHSCLVIPFGRQDIIEDWYNVPALGHLRLTTQGGAAVGSSPEAQIVIQQLRA